MTFSPGDILTAANLNDLDIDSLTVDTNVLVVDKTNNRVGIGTTSPQTPLGVSGDIDIVGNDRAIVFGRQNETGPHGLEVWDSGAVEGALYYRTTPNSWSFEDGSGTKIVEFDTDNTVTTFGGNVTSAHHFTAQSGGADGGIVLGQTFSTGYVGLRTAGMAESGSEYVIMSSGTNTYVSAGTGGTVYIRGPANDSTNEVIVSGSGVTIDGTTTCEDNLTVNGYISTDEIRDRTGQQLVIGAGESQGKHSGMTGELVYLTAEAGIQIRTPDSGHPNYQSGWVERAITIGQGKMTFPDAVEDKIQLYSQYIIGIEGNTMRFTSNRYFRFYEYGDTGMKVQIDTNTHGIVTCYADTTTADYISIYADTSWSRIHASQQIYINNWIHPDPGVRTYDNGSAGSPVYGFRTDTNTGMYRSASDQLTLTAGGTACLSAISGTVITGNIVTNTLTGYRYVVRNSTFGTYYYYSSSGELKEQINTVTGSGAIIDALRPVTFIPKFLPRDPTPDDHEDEFDPTVETDAQRILREADLQYGFIAEEVAQVADGKLAQYEWTDDGQLKPNGWKWPDIIAVLTAEVQSLRARVSELELAA